MGDIPNEPEFTKIFEAIECLNNEMEEMLPAISGSIDFIIRTKSRSIEDIERLLDTLLGYASLGKGISEFKRLNSYYSKVDSENSEIYARFLDDAVRG